MGGTLTKVLHFSDLHLGIEAHGKPDPATGINQRILDVAARFDEIVDHALAEAIDLVLFAGDAFRNATPHPTWQKMMAERVRRLTKGGVRVFLLAGNHDLPRMTANVTAFSVYSALEAEHVWIAERADVYPIPLRDGGIVQVAAIPHFWPRALVTKLRDDGTDADPDTLAHDLVAKTVKALAKKVDPAYPALLTAHLELRGAVMSDTQDRYDTTEVRVGRSALANDAFPFVALGHIHQRQEWPNGDGLIAYSGSPERVDFGEEGETKGFYVASFDGPRFTGARFVEDVLNPRTFLTIDTGVGEDDPTDAVLAEIAKHDATGAITRVRVRAPRERFALVDQRRVHDALASAYEVSIVCVPPEEMPSIGIDARFAEQLTEKAALAEYVRGEYPKDAEALIALGNELIDEVTA